jgi:hypothetical protein
MARRGIMIATSAITDSTILVTTGITSAMIMTMTI